MSAPTLSQAGPILEGHSFYNPPESISPATSVTNEEYTQGPEESVPVGGAFEIPIDPKYISAPHIIEDARVTQLRELDQMFQKMARETSGYACIPMETFNFLPSITQGLIQLFKEQQVKVDHLEIGQLQRNQDTFQSEVYLRGHVSWLHGENRKLQVKIDDLRDALSEAEQNYTSIKAQKDFLKSALELEQEANSESSNKETSRKRIHRE